MGKQGTAGEIELASRRQYVKHRPRDEQRSRAFGYEGVGDQVLPIDNRDRTRPMTSSRLRS
jgi:hypothetical protein